MKRLINKILFVLFISITTINAAGQLQVTETNNALILAQRLVGEGVSISNVTVTNSSGIIPTGLFTNLGGNAIGIDSGIILTSGRVKSDFRNNIFGVDGNGTTNASFRLASGNLGLPGDITLANELGISVSVLFDAVALEFDFVPLGDSIRFNYIMSSEEYTPGSVCIFNDAFGFFISGPGFTGTKNIALIPNTNSPVTITNINDIPSAGCVNNPQYYVDNSSNNIFLHDGHTKLLAATAKVIPCETYHLKLVVSDRGDPIWDTGVFLQAKSLSSNAIGITNLIQKDPTGSSYLVEGCNAGTIVIRRPRKDPTPLLVSLSYTGSATNGIDMQTLPSSVTIPANDSFVVINVIPIIDNIAEGIENIVVYALAGCAAGTPTDSTTIQIRDYDILELIPDTAIICRNASIQLNAASGYSIYQWNADPTLSNTNTRNPFATPVNNSTKYICTATEGTCNAKDSVLIKWKELKFLSKVDVNCAGAFTGNIKVTGGSEWTQPVQFSLDGINWQADSSFNNLPKGNYWVKIRDAICTDSINVVVAQAFPDLVINNAIITAATCTGGPDGVLEINANGGNGIFQYSVNNSAFQPDNTFNLAAGNYNITIKDGNNCSLSQNVTIPLNNLVTLDPFTDITICEGTSILIPTFSNADTYLWTPAATLNNATAKNPVASPISTTKYYVTATTGICNRTDSVIVSVMPAPLANAGADIAVCYGKVFQLDGTGGTTYQWTPSTYFTTGSNIAAPFVKATENITYYLTVTDANNCTSLQPDPVEVKVTPAVKIFAGRDTVSATNQPIQLQVRELSNTGVTEYAWSPGNFLNDPRIANPVATLPFDFRFIVTGTTAEGCEGKDDVFIKVYLGPEIYVPTGFTPNNDGKNDILKAIPVGISQFKFLRVYNRWGQIIFSTQDPSRGWDGRINGVEQPTGTFIWMAEAIDYKGNTLYRKGVLTLIR